MKLFLKNRWFLLLVLAVFIACKVPHLFYPYYWDESWPYATAIRAMHDHGISLLPDAIDSNISRGHPLLFHAAAATWMKIFGSSHLAMHSFSLLISLLLLVAIFEISYRLFSQRAAVMALLLVVSLELFFVQSSFVMLEVPVACLCLLSLYCYLKDKYVLTALCLTALFYTKESGLLMGFALGIDALVGLFSRQASRRTVFLRLVSVSVPIVLIAGFFVLQKHMLGWYIFPLHVGKIEHDWQTFWMRLRLSVVQDTFCRNFRFYYFLLLAVLAIIAAVKNRNIRFLAVLIPMIFVWYFIDDMRAGRLMPGIPFFTLFVIGWFWYLHTLCHPTLFKTLIQRRFIFLAGSFILLFLCFSAINFYVYRYQMAPIMLLFIVTAALFDAFILYTWKAVSYYITLAVFGVIAYFAYTTKTPHIGDADLAAFSAMEVQQATISYLEDSGYYDKHISAGGYLDIVHLTDPGTGFLRTDRPFTRVKWEIDDTTEFILFNNIESDYRYGDKREADRFRRVYRFQKGLVWSEVYKRTK